MAAAGLVPHQLPDGRMVMVPDYLVPPDKRDLSLPPGAPPPSGPDQRTTQLTAGQSSTPGLLSQLSPDFAKVQDFANQSPEAIPGAMVSATRLAPQVQDAEQRAKAQDSARALDAAKASRAEKANPKTLKPVPRADPRHASTLLTDTASALYPDRPTGGRGSAPQADPQNLTPAVAEIKQDRTPGRELLPEQLYRMGMGPRPTVRVKNPDYKPSTWGTGDDEGQPEIDVDSPLLQGAAATGDAAQREAQRQLEGQREVSVSRQEALIKHSQALDQHLSAIAQRRDRIAKLQDTADRRMEEAKSFEPRSREQIWSEKGPLAQIMGAISIALGGYTQGLGRNGGKNPGWEMINKFLDDAAADDRAKYDRKERLGINAKSALNDAMAVYGDLDLATMDNKQRKLANTIGLLNEQLGSRSLDATMKDRLLQIRTQAEDAYLAGKQQLFDQLTGHVDKEEVTLQPYGQVMQKATPKPVGGGGGGSKGVTGDQLRSLSKEQRELAVKMPDGTFKFVRSPQERIAKQEQMNAARDMRAQLEQLKAWRADKSNTIPWSEKRGKIEATAARLTELSKRKDQLGALDKGLLEFASKKFGSPEQFTFADQTIDGKIQRQIELLDSEVRNIGERDLDDSPYGLTEGGVTAEGVQQ